MNLVSALTTTYAFINIGLYMGNIGRVRRVGRVCRAPLLRRFHALRSRVVRRQRETGLSDFTASDRRLCGRGKAPARRPGGESQNA